MKASRFAPFRCLVVDDDLSVRVNFEHLGSDPDVLGLACSPYGLDLSIVGTQREALRLLKRQNYSLAFVDLELQMSAGGMEVIRACRRASESTMIVVISKNLRDARFRAHTQSLLGPRAIYLRALIDKDSTDYMGSAKEVLLHELTLWSGTRVKVSPLGAAVSLLMEKKNRLHSAVVTRAALAQEVEEIASRIYGTAAQATTFAGRPALNISPVAKPGRSSSVVLNAWLSQGSVERGDEIAGNRTILKIGLRSDILDEARRYESFVRFGVPLSQRVELLGVGLGFRLAGICYSFAGGSTSSAEPLSDWVLRDDDVRSRALEALFSPAHRSWLRTVGAEDIPVRAYFDRLTANGWVEVYEALLHRLSGLADRSNGALRWTNRRQMRSRGASGADETLFRLPERREVSDGPLMRRVEQRLEHGDMHLGNVLLERRLPALGREDVSAGEPHESPPKGRTALIDFARAGFAPRCFDATLLFGSILLEHSRSLTELDQELAIDGVREVAVACEQTWLLGTALPAKSRTSPSRAWVRAGRELYGYMSANFDEDRVPLTLEEWLMVSFCQAVRMTELKEVREETLLVVAAWASACWKQLVRLLE